MALFQTKGDTNCVVIPTDSHNCLFQLDKVIHAVPDIEQIMHMKPLHKENIDLIVETNNGTDYGLV